MFSTKDKAQREALLTAKNAQEICRKSKEQSRMMVEQEHARHSIIHENVHGLEKDQTKLCYMQKLYNQRTRMNESDFKNTSLNSKPLKLLELRKHNLPPIGFSNRSVEQCATLTVLRQTRTGLEIDTMALNIPHFHPSWRTWTRKSKCNHSEIPPDLNDAEERTKFWVEDQRLLQSKFKA